MNGELMNEEKLQTKVNPINVLSVRQIPYRIFEHFSLPAAEKSHMDVNHLLNLELKK